MRPSAYGGAALVLGVAIAGVPSCSSDDAPKQNITLTGEALRDPTSCVNCHADQFREWAGSMHAYAAEDPVFLAMNRRMQRETNGALGDLCVRCHAPVAVRLGLTTDGLNLSQLPASVKGVTCYFCHTAGAIEGAHNNPIKLADDDTLRGGIKNPITAMPHRGVYSSLHDREGRESADLCGSCHDVVTPHGAHIERTFDEWKKSLYSQPGQLACGKCHMEGHDKPAASVAGAPTRKVHDHSMPGVDVALTPFVGATEQRVLVQKLLDSTILVKLCVKQTPLGFVADVTLDNAFAGHAFPSGANQDRRTWVELVAYDTSGVEMLASGRVEDKKAASLYSDPTYWLLRDRGFTPEGKETHLFWETARVEPEQLPPAVTNDPLDPAFIHSVTRSYPLPRPPSKVEMRVRMRPLDFDLLDDLVASGDLDPAVLDKVPTYDIASGAKVWTFGDGGYRCVN